MFESTLNSSWHNRSRRGVTTVTSFALQALTVAALLALPLLRPPGLPSFHHLSTPVSLGPTLVEPSAPAMRMVSRSTAPITPTDITLRTPSQIPKGIPSNIDDVAPQIGNVSSNIVGTGSGDANGVANLLAGGSRPILPAVRPATAVAPLRISNMNEGSLIRKVQPAYPVLARSARIQGAVVLQALISKQGTIENLKVLSGHPMLVPAAIDAVQQWRYRPYILNSEPVEVETQITVNFSLAGN